MGVNDSDRISDDVLMETVIEMFNRNVKKVSENYLDQILSDSVYNSIWTALDESLIDNNNNTSTTKKKALEMIEGVVVLSLSIKAGL